MNYELAKKLKEEKFPAIFHAISEDMWSFPSLSKLIEALPRDRSLGIERNYGGEWTAYWDTQQHNPVNGWVHKALGSTPEEAVANLWLKLNP